MPPYLSLRCRYAQQAAERIDWRSEQRTIFGPGFSPSLLRGWFTESLWPWLGKFGVLRLFSGLWRIYVAETPGAKPSLFVLFAGEVHALPFANRAETGIVSAMSYRRRSSSAFTRAFVAGRSAQRSAERQRLLMAFRLPSSLTRRRHHAAVAGLLALFLQVLVPLGQAVPMGTDAHGLPRSLVVCSANGGLRTVPLPAAVSTSTGSSAASNGFASGVNPVSAACSVCLAYAAGGHLTLPPSVPLPLPRDMPTETILPTALALTVGAVDGLPQPRAPPGTVWGTQQA